MWSKLHFVLNQQGVDAIRKELNLGENVHPVMYAPSDAQIKQPKMGLGDGDKAASIKEANIGAPVQADPNFRGGYRGPNVAAPSAWILRVYRYYNLHEC